PELRKETVIIESYYDSISAVPALAPGAESSCGIAALLEAARAFKANPPGRTVRFLATSGHFQALVGMRQWCRDYFVWEGLMTASEAPDNNDLFAPPKEIWPTEEDLAGLGEEDTQPEWKTEDHPIMYASIDLSSQSDQVGVFFKGNFYDLGLDGENSQLETRIRKRYSSTGKQIVRAAQRIRKSEDIATRFVNCVDPIRGRGWRTYLPGPIALNNEVPLMYGKAQVGLATVNDARMRVDSPLDTTHHPDGTEKLDFESVRQQAKLVTGLLWDLASREDPFPLWDTNSAAELYVSIKEDSLIKFLPGSPLPDTLLAIELNTHKALMGVRGTAMAMSNQDGYCLTVGTKIGYLTCTPSKVDRRDGTIEFIGAKSLAAARAPVINKDWEKNRIVDGNLPLFTCSSTLIFDFMNQLTNRTFETATVLDAKTNSPPRQYSASFVGWSLITSSYSEPCAVVFVERGDSSLKIIGTRSIVGAKYMLLNSTGKATPDESQGMGFPANEREHRILRTTYVSARDMWRLDDFRLKELEKTGVRHERASYLHNLAEQRLKQAEKDLEKKDYAAFLNNSREAWAYEARAYPNVRGAADDVIKGLIFYMAVLLPFAVFAERLFFAFSDVRKKLFGIAGMFAAIYLVLSYVHPGFQLATTPVIILAGFFMIVLGAITIGILFSKFNTQMVLMREKAGTWHREDVNRSSAASAAFMLGISNLRRRKVRTALTCITIVLLTFTVLSFTSFQTSVVPNEIPTDYDSTYKGVLIRHRSWSSFEQLASFGLKEYFAKRGGVVVERSWYSSGVAAKEDKQIELSRVDDPGVSVVCHAIIGLEPEEKHLTRPQEHLVCGEWFDPAVQRDYPLVCIVPKAMSAGARGGLHVTSDNVGKVYVNTLGKKLRVIGVFDDQEFKDVKDLDNEPLTPIDYVREGTGTDQARALQLSTDDEGVIQPAIEAKPPPRYEHIDPGRVVLLPNQLVQGLDGSTVRSLAVGMTGLTEEDIDAELRRYVARSKLLLFAGITEKVKLFSSRDALSASGMKALFLPIAIASLIVFNTMLGSVYERLREIAVYTSCGLAPVHVAALFLAEASVFATIGAVVGYLLGQGVAKYVTVTGRLAGLNLNYSSVSAVSTIILVVCVVLLSTLYPARKAVQLSVPDETKKMKLPKPDSDTWEFDFPFTVGPLEAVGLNAFIHDYFSSHNEDSGGVFCADSVGLAAKQEGPDVTYVLDSTVWIEPMDMGISQKVVLETLPPPPDDKVCTIKFTIHRISGEVEAWGRMNYGFLKAIRKQMLIWRLVDDEHKQIYEQQGHSLIAESSEV
ncbi:MAG: FtsX-like permease family protein, partial [Planctomycetes bacterium]|nr:FtsX-like permease family protein [Planctomycetota bacterium]